MGKYFDKLREKFSQIFEATPKEDVEPHVIARGQEVLDELYASTKTRVTDKEDSYINNPSMMRGSGSRGAIDYVQRHELQQNPKGYVNKSPILTNKAFFVSNPRHREIVHQSNALFSAAIKKIRDAVTENDPIFALPDASDVEDREDNPEIHEEAARVWKEYRLQAAWAKCIEKSIKHGFILYHEKENLPDWYTGPPWRIVAADELSKGARALEYEYDHPVKWHVRPSNKHLDEFDIDIRKKGLYYDPFNSDDFDSMPWWLGAWDNVIDYEMIKEARNAFDQRLGNGFIVIGIPRSEYRKYKSVFEDKVQNIRTETGLVFPISNDKEPLKIDWMGMSGKRVDFNADLEDVRKDIIAEIGFPKRWLFGDQEGAMESSGKDRLQAMDQIRHIFKKWKRFMKMLLKYHGAISDFDEVEILAPYELQLTEHEKAELENLKASTIALQDWLTINEKREKVGFDPIEGGDTRDTFNEVMGTGEAPPEVNAEEATTLTPAQFSPNTDAKTDSYTHLREEFKKCSYRDLEEFLGVSKNTVGRIKEKFRQDASMKVNKCDALAKSDAMQVDNNIWTIQGLVVPVQEKYYEDLGYHSVRSYKAIAEYFNDDTNPKQYRIGVNGRDNHDSPFPLEVTDEQSVGTVEFTSLSEKGIEGIIKFDLDKVTDILGPDNWIERKLTNGEKLPTSVALRSVDIPVANDKKRETQLDIRSFIFTRKPRNELAGGT